MHKELILAKIFFQYFAKHPNQFINVSNLKFGSTWACICEIQLHMASITDDVIVSWDIPSFQELLITQINASISCTVLK